MSSLIRPNVLRMRPYSPGKPIEEVRRELGLSRIVKLASNENPWGPSPLAIAAVKAAAEEMHLYPDIAAFDLRKALSSHFDIPMSQIIVGDGSEELIALIGLTLINSADDEVVVADPTFVRYAAAAELAPCKIVRVPLDAALKHDLRAMAEALTPKTRLVFIANPNNPTGTVVGKADFEYLLDRLPANAVIVLDEAYYEFAAPHFAEYPSSQDYLSTGKVVGLRTFSKAYGLAGLRVGYGFFPEWLADGILRTRAPFSVSSLAQAGAVAALADDAHLKKTVTGTREGLQRLSAALEKVGAKPIPSYANFVWADFGRPARAVYQSLLERGVIIRPGDVLGNENFARISVGTAEEMTFFEEALFEVIKEAAVR